MILVMVRKRTVYASLWKMIMTDVDGREEGYVRSTHLGEEYYRATPPKGPFPTYLGSLVSGTCRFSGIRSLRNWLKPLF